MSSASIWLLPPRPDHPFAKSLAKLIADTVPSNYPSGSAVTFDGHLSLTGTFDAAHTYESPKNAQKWLDSLELPEGMKQESKEVVVEFMELEAGDNFFRKLYLTARKDVNLLALASILLVQIKEFRYDEHEIQVSEPSGAEEWAQSIFKPHLSLLYSDVSKQDIELKMHKVELQLGFEFGDLFACCGGMLAGGARLALIDTSSKDTHDWRVLAERQLDWVVWRAARALV